jgi:hypothetical protein
MRTGTRSGGHAWRFWRAGGVDQVRLDRGADLVHLDELDQRLWVALSCPVKGLEFDERTLALLDTDRDGRVRAPEIIAVSRWLRTVLKDPETLLRGEGAVALANVDTSTPEGKRVREAARLILESLGKGASDRISIEDTQKTADVFAAARRNGDGVVPPDVIDDAEARAVAAEILDTLGGVPDRSGKPGVDAERVKRFFAEAEAYAAWWAAGEVEPAKLRPLGDATAAAAAVYEALEAKAEDYFARCRLAAFDPRAQSALNRKEEDYVALAGRDLGARAKEIAAMPLALVEAGRPLPLAGAVNPAWSDTLAAFRDAAAPLLGKDATSLTEAEWRSVGATLAPYRAWVAAKQGASVEKLGVARLRTVLRGASRAALESAIAEDLAVAPHVEAITEVEKLARCHRDFHPLVNNYVAFTEFYSGRKAIFQAGTLYLDGRSCDLCVPVNDPAKHASLAGMSGACLVYADCTRASGERMQVAAAVTSGSSDNLFPGRNGLFYDRRGRDWDATVAKLVDHPISVRQAFWSPYRKLIRWVEDQVAKRATAADAAAAERLQAATASASAGARPDAAPAPKPKFDVGTVAALGVAVGGITAAMGALLNSLFGLRWLMPLGILGLLLLVSGPAMLVAWLKLRRRNLGPLLDANGWAVNTLTKVNIPLGGTLTKLAVLPPGAERSLTDPYAPKRAVWPGVLLALVVLAALGFLLWKTGHLSEWLPRLVPAPDHVWHLPGS